MRPASPGGLAAPRGVVGSRGWSSVSVAAVEFGDVVSIALGVEPRHRAFGEVVAITGLPFVVHVREHGADESDHGGFVGEDAHDPRPTLDFFVDRSSGFVDQIFCQCARGNAVKASTCRADGVGVGLGEDGAEHRGDHVGVRPRDQGEKAASARLGSAVALRAQRVLVNRRRLSLSVREGRVRYRRSVTITATDPKNSTTGNGLDVTAVRRAVKVAALEALATYLVRRSLELGYRQFTGRELPTARDRNVPFRQVMVWATVTGAALSAATVVVDQFALRRETARR